MFMRFSFHLKNPTIAAQTDSVHRVVGVGDGKHLDEEDEDNDDVVEEEGE